MSDIQTVQPVPGKQYLVKEGDELNIIAARAYGDSTKWPRIFQANQTRLKSGDANLIFPGEVIYIPVLLEKKETPAVTGKANNIFTLRLNDIEVPVLSARVIRTMDTVSDGWSAKIAWTPGEDEKLDELTKPYAYTKSNIFLGNQLVVSGPLYTVIHSKTLAGITKDLQGFSFTADLVDSTIKPPYETSKTTLKQRCEDLLTPLEMKVEIDADDIDGQFDRVTSEPQETISQHLTKLSKQRAALLSSNEEGNLLITKANINSKSVATIRENETIAEEFNATFDGRKRYNAYKVIAQSPKSNAKTATSIDKNVPKTRFKTISANDSLQGEVQKIADWQRSKQLAEALTIPLPVKSWYDPSGSLWKENTIVTVISPVLGIPDGFDFLISKAEFIYQDSGTTAILSIVPPQVYTGEEIPAIW